MIFRLSSFVFGLVWAFAACQSPKTTVPEPASATPTQVTYTVAERYFVKNDVQEVPLQLNTQAEFDAVFGAAPVMRVNTKACTKGLRWALADSGRHAHLWLTVNMFADSTLVL